MAKYDIAEHWETLSPAHQAQAISLASDKLLAEWANDPDCNQKFLCSVALSKRELQSKAFDKRTEVSADARYIAGRIVKHLWIIFVALPFVLGILILILK